MAGIKNFEIATILRNWLYVKHISQAKAARLLNVNPSVLSRQLQGKESIPYDRIEKMIKLFSPCQEETDKINSLLDLYNRIDHNTEQSSKVRMHGLINFHSEDKILAALLEVWPEDQKDKIELLSLANSIYLRNEARLKNIVSQMKIEDIETVEDFKRFVKENPDLIERWKKEDSEDQEN